MKTPNMLLTLPTVGVNGTQGPQWASELVDSLTSVDYHNHIEGRGKTLNNNSFVIDADFAINFKEIKEIASLALLNLGTQPTTLNLCYDFNGEFYFNDKNGNKVQITNGGTINVPSVDGITGDYTTSDADLSYSSTSKSFIFKQTALITASTDHGPLKIYRPTLGSGYAQIKQNDSQSTDLDFTWPSFLPTTSQVIRSTDAGVLNPSELQSTDIVDGSILNSKMANDSVETPALKNSSVTSSKRVGANYVVSANTGTLALGLAVNTFVSQLQITITTIGRPVMVGVKSAAGSQGTLYLYQNILSISSFWCYRNGSLINPVNLRFGSINSNQVYMPPNILNFLDTPSAGTYTYTFRFITGTNTGLTIQNVQSYAYEL